MGRVTDGRDETEGLLAGLVDGDVIVVAIGIGIAATLLAGVIPLVSEASGLLGTAVVAFAYGTAGYRSYPEVGVAGAVVGTISGVLDPLGFLLGVGPSLVGLTAVAGTVLGVGAHYLGRDLRAGVTRQV